MSHYFKKILIIFIAMFVTFSVASCDNLTSIFTEDPTTISTTTTAEPTTTEEATTAVETTVTIITTQETTTEPITTVTSTTTEPITTTATTTTQTVTTTTYADGSRLEVTSPTKTVYEVYDTINLTGMVVSFIDSGNQTTVDLQSSEYTVSQVSMRTYGNKQVYINYNDYETSFLIEVNLPNYYLSATDLNGSNLFLQLRTIVNNGFDGVSYGDARYILDETDADPNNPDNVILVYTQLSVDETWDLGATWNREHVWPQSLLPDEASNSSTNTASDLHNLKPADPGTNSSRGNKYFDDITTTLSYAPPNEVKGDVARILFYMIVMYDELSLVDTTPSYLEMGLFSVLLEWHESDPVDEFERNRNEIIYDYQGNKNPFIDYPEFVNLIWN
ncbi:MAG: endonuclease [Tenericutes bacterium]|nr:endonuclease [Mycoplasmatota bacterium]